MYLKNDRFFLGRLGCRPKTQEESLDTAWTEHGNLRHTQEHNGGKAQRGDTRWSEQFGGNLGDVVAADVIQSDPGVNGNGRRQNQTKSLANDAVRVAIGRQKV